MKNARLAIIGITLAPLLAAIAFSTAEAASKPAAKAAAKSTTPIASFGKKRDNHTPIEVTADTLEVMQNESKATFTGHVVAIQGDLRLTAETMTVFYAKREQAADTGKKPAKAPEKATAKTKEENAIRKIEAEGKVFLATPEETASGATAVYDVEEQEIHLTGHVVLTRGKNVLEGEKLVYNFATGKSKIESTNASAPAATGDKKRVRALFVPEKEKK